MLTFEEILDQAIAMLQRRGRVTYRTLRLQGELLLARSVEKQTVAESCFHHALDSARRQQAKWLGLRTVVSLSRLWQQQGKCEQASQLLAPIYG